MCSCLSISGMTQETLKWKLFPFSLKGKAKQWYTHVIESTNEDWDELIYKFCLAFFPMFRIVSLPRVILGFEQYKKESIGAAWPRFLALIHSAPDMFLPNSVLLRVFCSGLDMDSYLCLDMTIRGCFAQKTMTQEVTFLKRLIDSHSSSVIKTKPLQAKVMSSFEELSLAKSKPIPSLYLDSTHEPSPEPRTPKERVIHSSKFPIKFEDYGNASKHFWHKKPTLPSKEASPNAKPSKEWLMELKRISEAIQILSPSMTMPCSLRGTII